MIATEFLFSSITSPLLELNKNIWYASQRKVDVNRELSRDMRKNKYVWKKNPREIVTENKLNNDIL